jgi:phosphatidylglycerol:prolipoprotein diacylglycerol transferase
LFTFPGLDWEVQSYGLLLGAAFIVGFFVSLTLARADRLPTEPLGTIYVVSVAAALFAGRAVWVVQHPDAWAGWSSLVTLQAGTFAPFFAIFVGLAVSAGLVGRRKVPPGAWFDVAAPAFAIGVAFERLGALLAGSGEGTYAPGLPWAIRYPAGSPVFTRHLRTLDNLMPSGATESLPVHPTPIYGLLLALGGVALCVALRKRRRFTGQVFFALAVYFLVTRAFVEEWFRADAATAVFGPLNPGQVGAVLVVAALVFVSRARARAKTTLRAWEGGRWSPDFERKTTAKKRGTKAKTKPKPKGKA